MSKNRDSRNPEPEDLTHQTDDADSTDPMDPITMIHQLRVAVLLVGAVALVTSIMMNWFIFMVNNGYTDQLDGQRQRLAQISEHYGRYDRALRELVKIAPSKPAMMEVLRKYQPQPALGANMSSFAPPQTGPATGATDGELLPFTPPAPPPKN
jgi:hypothetical protein